MTDDHGGMPVDASSDCSRRKYGQRYAEQYSYVQLAEDMAQELASMNAANIFPGGQLDDTYVFVNQQGKRATLPMMFFSNHHHLL